MSKKKINTFFDVIEPMESELNQLVENLKREQKELQEQSEKLAMRLFEINHKLLNCGTVIQGIKAAKKLRGDK